MSQAAPEYDPPRQRIVRRDRYDRPAVARNFDTKAELHLIRRAANIHVCHGRCGKSIMDGTMYAKMHYPEGSIGVGSRARYWGFPLTYAYHIQCLPADANELIPLFFPEQEWKPVTDDRR